MTHGHVRDDLCRDHVRDLYHDRDLLDDHDRDNGHDHGDLYHDLGDNTEKLN